MLQTQFKGKFSDLKNLVGSSSTGRELIFLCPYCVTIRGKEDKEGRLYYNTTKGQGKCHKCGTPVFDDSSVTLKSVYKKFLETTEKVVRIPTNQQFNISFSKPVSAVPEAVEYLRKRGITEKTIQDFNIRATTIPTPGIVIPCNYNRVDSSCIFFQLRIINSLDKNWRYVQPSDTLKPIFGLDLVQDTKNTFMYSNDVFSVLYKV